MSIFKNKHESGVGNDQWPDHTSTSLHQDARANDTVERLNAIIETQHAVALAGLDLPRVMQIIAERMQDITGANGAAVELAEGEDMVYHAGSGSVASFVGLRLKLSASLSGYCVRTGEIICCNDTEQDDRVDREACRRVQARSMIVVPLQHQEKTIGVVKVLSNRAAAFGEGDIRILQLMAGLVGSVLGQAEEFDLKLKLLQERTENLNALRESEERFRLSFENGPIGKALVSLEGAWLQVNAALCRILEYSKGELHQLTFQEITHPEDLDADLEMVQELIEGKVNQYQMEKRYINKHGRTIWALLTVSLVRDSEGKPLYFISQIQDISKTKTQQQQLEAYAARLATTNEELKGFAHTASHDLKSPAKGIRSLCQLLQYKWGKDIPPDAKDILNKIMSGSERMSHLIDDILALSVASNAPLAVTQVDLAILVEQIADELKWTMRETSTHTGEIEPELDVKINIGPLPLVEGDASQLRQLFHNLLSNALKYRQADVAPIVEVSSKTTSGGRSCEVSVQDNGIGFEEHYAKQIFKPFQRLHGQGKYEGSGIGLSICAKVVQRHGGSIKVQSAVGQGSNFIVTLPLQQSSL